MPIRFAAALLFLLTAFPAAAEWKIGLGREKITPQEPVLMGGYASRLTPFTGVDADTVIPGRTSSSEKMIRTP